PVVASVLLPSLGPPMSAVLPLDESAVLMPNCVVPDPSLGTSFGPCCVHTPSERANTHAAPMCGAPVSPGPPISAVVPSSDSETLTPNRPPPTSSFGVSFGPCWTQTPFVLANTQAPPMFPLSSGEPTRAVFPSLEMATLAPNMLGGWTPGWVSS